MLCHRNSEERDRERDADPEAPRHIAQFRIFGVAPGGRHRLQRHAADRAASRFLAHDLRVHWTGPKNLAGLDWWAGRGGLSGEMTLRRSSKLLPAMGTAEK